MSDLRHAAQQALEAMESAEVDPHSSDAIHKAITALRAALAEPVQEPVAWNNQEQKTKRAKFEPIRIRIMQEAYDLADRDDSEGYNSVKVMCSEVLSLIDAFVQGELTTDAPPHRKPEPVVNQQLTTEPVQQGCDHCNHPMYVAIKCKVCGRVTEPVQEPYAWMSVGGSIWRHKTREDDVPLYTAPRKPLAEWQINDLMSDIDPEDRDSWSFRQGVYAAEKHHGVRR